ncbi:uncharacterized protein LOC144452330 [Glandiceps talaboti]
MLDQLSERKVKAEKNKFLSGNTNEFHKLTEVTDSKPHSANDPKQQKNVMSDNRRPQAESTSRYRKPKMKISKSVDYERLPQDDPTSSPPTDLKKYSQGLLSDSKHDTVSKSSTPVNEKVSGKASLGRKKARAQSDGALSNDIFQSVRMKETQPSCVVGQEGRVESRSRSVKERHPTKKLLRTNSESAIQVNRFMRQHSLNQPRSASAGIVCSNDDLKHIIKTTTQTTREKRSIGSIGRLMSLPEISPIGKENISSRPKIANFERIGRSAEAPASTGSSTSVESFSSPLKLSSRQSPTPSTSTTMNKANPLTHVLTSSSNQHVFPNVIYEGSYESEEELPEFELKPISEVMGAEGEETNEEEACETSLTEKSADAEGLIDASVFSAFDPELLGKAIEARLSEELVREGADETSVDERSGSKSKRNKGDGVWVPNQEHQGSKWQSLLAKLNLRKKEEVTNSGVKV